MMASFSNTRAQGELSKRNWEPLLTSGAPDPSPGPLPCPRPHLRPLPSLPGCLSLSVPGSISVSSPGRLSAVEAPQQQRCWQRGGVRRTLRVLSWALSEKWSDCSGLRLEFRPGWPYSACWGLPGDSWGPARQETGLCLLAAPPPSSPTLTRTRLPADSSQACPQRAEGCPFPGCLQPQGPGLCAPGGRGGGERGSRHD